MRSKRVGRLVRVLATGVLAVVMAGAALVVPAGAVALGPSVAVEAACDAGEGFIRVEIVDDSAWFYDVYIDEELVDEGVTDSGGGFFSYGPYEGGTYTVGVVWFTGKGDIPVLETEVTVDCQSDGTTPSTDGTTATTATPTTPTTAGAARAAVASPRFTG